MFVLLAFLKISALEMSCIFSDVGEKQSEESKNVNDYCANETNGSNARKKI